MSPHSPFSFQESRPFAVTFQAPKSDLGGRKSTLWTAWAVDEAGCTVQKKNVQRGTEVKHGGLSSGRQEFMYLLKPSVIS